MLVQRPLDHLKELDRQVDCEDSPVRLCNAYRLDDQQQLGRGLMCLAAAVVLL